MRYLINYVGGYSVPLSERRQGTGISLVSAISERGGQRRKGGDPRWL